MAHDDDPEGPTKCSAAEISYMRFLARQIKTPAEFERVLSDADPHLREAVRAQIEPLLSFKMPSRKETRH